MLDENGRPQIGSTLRELAQRTGPGIWTASQGIHALTVKDLAEITIGPDTFRLMVGAVSTPQAFNFLKQEIESEGGYVRTLKQCWETPAIRRALAPILRKLRRKSDGTTVALVPNHNIAGQDVAAESLDDGEDLADFEEVD